MAIGVDVRIEQLVAGWHQLHCAPSLGDHLRSQSQAGIASRILGRERLPEREELPKVAAHDQVTAGCDGDRRFGHHRLGQWLMGHTGQLIGRDSLVPYNTKTGASFVAIVNET